MLRLPEPVMQGAGACSPAMASAEDKGLGTLGLDVRRLVGFLAQPLISC